MPDAVSDTAQRFWSYYLVLPPFQNTWGFSLFQVKHFKVLPSFIQKYTNIYNTKLVSIVSLKNIIRIWCSKILIYFSIYMIKLNEVWLRTVLEKVFWNGRVLNNTFCLCNSKFEFLYLCMQDIWRHICSFLPLKDAARAACMSHSFKRLWRCRPNLTFSKKTMGYKKNARRRRITRRDYNSRVDHILGNHLGTGVKTQAWIIWSLQCQHQKFSW